MKTRVISAIVMITLAAVLGYLGGAFFGITIFVASVIECFCNVQIDGFIGLAVAIFIIYSGIILAKETMSPLLGEGINEELKEVLEDYILSCPKVVGCHDLIVHDYGPGRRIISLHAEVPAEGNMMSLHDVIDNLEMKLREDLGCLTTIHMDPVVTTDERVTELKERCAKLIGTVGEKLTLHDFRVVFGDTHTNMIFDVVVPFEFYLSDVETTKLIQEKVWQKIGKNYFVVITIDKPAVRV